MKHLHLILLGVLVGLQFLSNWKVTNLVYPYDPTEVVVNNLATDKQSAWDIAIQEAKELLSDGEAKQGLPSCLVPDREKTLAFVRDAQAANPSANRTLVPLPLFNGGMPKMGSTTLFHFFKCKGFRATHYNENTNDFQGLCMRDAASIGLPPLEMCGKFVGGGDENGKPTEAFMEANVMNPFAMKIIEPFPVSTYRDECFFPQLSLLEEIHAENPNVTFFLNFRPMKDWIKSLRHWYNMLKRFKKCHLPNMPYGIPEDINDDEQVEKALTQFFCSHVQHLRNFVKAHPSHALIELDLYDSEYSSGVMEALFPGPAYGKQKQWKEKPKNERTCWGHSNKNKKLDRDQKETEPRKPPNMN